MTASLYYLAGWSSVGSAQKMTCTAAGNSVTLASATWSHSSFEAITGTGNYSSFAAGMQAALNTAGGGPWTVTLSGAGVYTISRATNFTLVFNPATTANVLLAQALGFSTGTRTGANSYSSDLFPYYYIVPDMIGRTASLPLIYEPPDIVMEAVSDGGTPYAVSKDTTELWSDWVQAMEPETTVYDRFAVSTRPYTWQMFWRHVRGQYPFGVYEADVSDGLYLMRASAGSWKPIPVVVDWIELSNMKFEARYLGDL